MLQRREGESVGDGKPNGTTRKSSDVTAFPVGIPAADEAELWGGRTGAFRINRRSMTIIGCYGNSIFFLPSPS